MVGRDRLVFETNCVLRGVVKYCTEAIEIIYLCSKVFISIMKHN